ncbi:hypothetical protein EV421DRAFT_236565 [Armillaria borealis]|uniref:Uncharacterized protein n=1 Tax=Armillaria borealis TaxID=47425 RepID=A0AA39MDK0_9AGAR|nr:hypothetical protein EV421DRAFT_236565 [Armillaria borealis]
MTILQVLSIILVIFRTDSGYSGRFEKGTDDGVRYSFLSYWESEGLVDWNLLRVSYRSRLTFYYFVVCPCSSLGRGQLRDLWTSLEDAILPLATMLPRFGEYIVPSPLKEALAQGDRNI